MEQQIERRAAARRGAGDMAKRSKTPDAAGRHRRGPFGFYNELSEPDDNPSDKAGVKREFGRRLAAAMDAKGWNQSELARRATEWLPQPAKGQRQGDAIGRDAISNYIRGTHLPRPVYLRAIARALDIQTRDLMPAQVPTVSSATPEWSMQSSGPGKVRVRIDTELSVAGLSDLTTLLAKYKA